ncbi:DNA-binding transcriptional regulator, Lrp family [Desulfomicrobium norvegicum]|uniref:siroheme decarboxylase n=1 Tax=Desulfomicrobium norvegicum (strain DSM 1741 / NCIMB 8310) TaxID=52561 RepID=A0A8G2C0S6_DESNO|nr:Lrp/AsnC family transcriptional regulator [Desulfomicrobium norvegicum]SFL41539.1 DNA-binding transcriptional regulator, Lrp family [Desulfomicrobium norvegicum]
MDFTQSEHDILRIVQDTLPDSATPYADIARQTGSTEEEVLALLKKLKKGGQIRRFGATLRHQQAGYGFNAMVAWYIEEGFDPDEVGRIMATRPEISHCYLRPNCMDWPYDMYTMIHGKSREDCMQVVQALMEQTGVTQYEMLFSIKELKKTSMEYF